MDIAELKHADLTEKVIRIFYDVYKSADIRVNPWPGPPYEKE